MSRVGKLPVEIPEQIKVEVIGDELKFSNDKLSRTYKVRPNVEVKFLDKKLKLSSKGGNKLYSVDVGMDRSNINNIVLGMVKPFEILLEVNGVGYKASISHKVIILSLGYSHEIFYSLPEYVVAIFEKPNIIRLSSHDKVLVGKVADEIISFRKPEPYKGKGVKIFGSKILRKEGKKK